MMTPKEREAALDMSTTEIARLSTEVQLLRIRLRANTIRRAALTTEETQLQALMRETKDRLDDFERVVAEEMAREGQS